MKTLKYIIITLACLLLFVSCDNTPADDTQSSAPAVSQKSTEPITTDTETDTQQPPIGGTYDTLAQIYRDWVQGVCYIPDTFTGKYEEEIGEIFERYYPYSPDIWCDEENCPIIMYEIIHELNISRDDYEIYNEKVWYEYQRLTDEMIDALFSNDEAFRKRVLKSPYAVYADDGHIYSFRDLQDMTTAEIEALGLSEQEWADYIATVTPELPPMDSVDFLLPFAGDATPTTTAPESISPETTAEPDTSI